MIIMGYWEQGPDGVSFARTEGEQEPLIWGDQPADIIGNALWEVKVAFLRDLGRLPSVAEILAGIAFSTNILDEDLPKWPENAKPITAEQHKVIEQYGWTATGGDVGRTQKQIDAVKMINEVLKELGAR